MSRTYSFCASSSDQNYNSASSSSRPSIPFHRQRIPTPSSSKAKAGTQLVAPMMERSISTLGIDGLQMTQYDGGLPPSRCATPLTPRDSNVEVESPVRPHPHVFGIHFYTLTTLDLDGVGSRAVHHH